jgi:hypothetical protein
LLYKQTLQHDVKRFCFLFSTPNLFLRKIKKF